MGSHQVDELVARVADSDGSTRQRARETLVAIGEPALPVLLELLASPQVRVRWEAAKALTEIPDPVAIPGGRPPTTSSATCRIAIVSFGASLSPCSRSSATLTRSASSTRGPRWPCASSARSAGTDVARCAAAAGRA